MSSSVKIRLLKVLLLGLVAGTLATVVLLYRVGKEVQFPTSLDPVPIDSNSGTQQLGSGFDHTVSRDGIPLFRMRGGRDRRDQDGNLFVEEVLMTVFRENGDELEVVADRAEYSIAQESANLLGNVSVAGEDGLTLQTEELNLLGGGRILQSEGEVKFRYGERTPIEGRSDRLRIDLETELFIFAGNVRIVGGADQLDGYELRANRVFVERENNLIRATGKVNISWRGSFLYADKVAAHLNRVTDKIQFLRAHWNVRALMVTGEADSQRWTRLRGSRLGLLFEGKEGAISRVEIEDEIRGRARIRSASALGTTVLWKTRFFQGDFKDGVLTEVAAEGRAEIFEYLTDRPDFLIRRICSDRSTARFDARGDLAQINVFDAIDLQDQQFQVLADTARITPTSVSVDGNPVLVDGVLGSLTAPRISFSENNGLIHATGGVDVLIRAGGATPMSVNPMAPSDEPVRVTSTEAFVRPATQSFLFKGDVRAWSDQRVLHSQQLQGEANPQKLVASGGVENVFFVDREEAGETRRVQVRVRAENMVYDADQGSATYNGRVKVLEIDHELNCDSLKAELNEEGVAERFLCSGSVLLEDLVEGRTIAASTAEYDVGLKEVVFHGTPVKLKERSGGELEGATLVYSITDQTVRVRSRSSNLANQ